MLRFLCIPPFLWAEWNQDQLNSCALINIKRRLIQAVKRRDTIRSGKLTLTTEYTRGYFMLENCKSREERWDGVNELIERWLAERQELIVLYCSLSGVHAYSPNSLNSLKKLKSFCQILVDYVSAGHFEVYDQLIKEAEDFEESGAEVLAKVLPEISLSTEVALDFNDMYDTDEHCQEKLGELKRNLSALGELLVNRFELEDRLIEELHGSHAELLSA